jgi:hypothetical protein
VSREQDDNAVARSVEQSVYNVVEDLLPLSYRAYKAVLRPDPRDAALAAKAFGSDLPRLVWLKNSLDPHNVLAHACPPPKELVPKLIILVTGESCAAKDYCAKVWASFLSRSTSEDVLARPVSVSDETKRGHAAATGMNLHRLLQDRGFKKQHRQAFTAFYRQQM